MGTLASTLLPRYQHLDVLLRIDQVAVVVFTDLEFDPIDLAGELAALHVALGSNRRPGLVNVRSALWGCTGSIGGNSVFGSFAS